MVIIMQIDAISTEYMQVDADRCNQHKYMQIKMQKESISSRSSRPRCETVTIMQIDAISTEYMQIDAISTELPACILMQIDAISTEYMQVDADRCDRHKYMQKLSISSQSSRPCCEMVTINADRCDQHRMHADRCR
jgi:hypothetical protein